MKDNKIPVWICLIIPMLMIAILIMCLIKMCSRPSDKYCVEMKEDKDYEDSNEMCQYDSLSGDDYN